MCLVVFEGVGYLMQKDGYTEEGEFFVSEAGLLSYPASLQVRAVSLPPGLWNMSEFKKEVCRALRPDTASFYCTCFSACFRICSNHLIVILTPAPLAPAGLYPHAFST